MKTVKALHRGYAGWIVLMSYYSVPEEQWELLWERWLSGVSYDEILQPYKKKNHEIRP